jgi:signal transduction histidine kinase
MKQETDGPLPSPLYKAWVNEIEASLQRLRTTHVKMLNFGQSLADGLTLKTAEFPLADLIDDALAATHDAMHKRQLTVQLNYTAPRRLKLDADRVLLLQALRSSLDYAEQFSYRDSEIEFGIQLDQAGQLVLSIRDTTPSLTPHQIRAVLGLSSPSLAESAEQATGLRMTRSLIEAHEGSITMTALPTRGMLTEIVLPASRVVASQSDMQNSSSALRNVA